MYVQNFLNIYQIFIIYITVNFRKKLYSCQAISYLFTNYQILRPEKFKKIYIFSNFTRPTDTAITKKHHKTPFCIFAYSL